MLNFFPHLIDHGEWNLKTKPVWSETTFNDSNKYWTAASYLLVVSPYIDFP